MSKKKILFIIGSPNQTSQMHQISKFLENDYECWFSQFYPDHFYERIVMRMGFLEATVMSGNFKANADKYLRENNLKNDYMAELNDYDMTVFCTDMLVPRKLRKTKTIWVQEGMTDPVTRWAKTIKTFKGAGYLAKNTSLNGTSNLCDIYCAASEGYKNHFAKLGTQRDKIVVTGIPNFDNIPQYQQNDFPYRDYVLVTTSDIRECFGKDDRIGFLHKCKEIANGRQLIFKLHPNERRDRAMGEIKQVIGEDTLIYTDGNSNHMVANCEELITQYSTLVYVGIVLGKKVHSLFNLDQLYKLVPEQNAGTSARKIAEICKGYMDHEGSGISYLNQALNQAHHIAA